MNEVVLVMGKGERVRLVIGELSRQGHRKWGIFVPIVKRRDQLPI